MAKTKSTLVIGVGGHAVALDPATGVEIWRTKLKTSTFVTVKSAGGAIYAGVSGELFCLDAATGAVLWHNRLKGLGMGLVAFDGGSEVLGAGAVAAAAAAAAASAGT